MGTWGTGLFQNDLSEDVRDDYIGKLKGGKSDEEALREILSEYKTSIWDFDEKYDFYIGLADTLWKKGRLTEEVKNKTLEIIEEEKISERWQSDKLKKERIKVLDKFKEKLLSPMPERKKVSIHKPYKIGLEEGGVYCFQIMNEIGGYEKYKGWYTLMYVDKIFTEDWIVREIQDEMADVFFFLQKEKPEAAEDILKAKKVFFFCGYRSFLCEESKRERPKDFTYLGKCHLFEYPEEPAQFCKTHFSWAGYIHERDILWGYERQLKAESMEK